MKILLYGINYAPELTGTGKYTSEMAESLAALGHTVRVVCAPPYYPEWRTAAGYSAMRYRVEEQNGVQIWRAPLWVPKAPRGAKRLAHLASFALCSMPLMIRHVLWRPDAVITVAPSLLNALAGWATARLTRAAAWLHIQDFEIEAAFDLGLLKGASVKRVALAIERVLMRRFDIVSTISAKMVERTAHKGVDPGKLFLFPNWVDTNEIFPLKGATCYRSELDISEAATVVLYSGNMGAKQGLEVLAAAAAALKHRAEIVFVFCGEGPAKEELARHCTGLSNCRFIPLQAKGRLNELLSFADIHVLPQRADAADLVMPSKLTGMLASGRAIIAMARAGTELFNAVTPRGVVVPPEEVAPLTRAIEALAADPGQRARLGDAARLFAEANLTRDASIEKFEAKLRTLCAMSTSNTVRADATLGSVDGVDAYSPEAAHKKTER